MKLSELEATDLDESTRLQLAQALHEALIATCNKFMALHAGHDVAVVLTALVASLGGLIVSAPEEKQGVIYREALTMLEDVYVCNVTKGNL